MMAGQLSDRRQQGYDAEETGSTAVGAQGLLGGGEKVKL